jgi:hypothetical protein
MERHDATIAKLMIDHVSSRDLATNNRTRYPMQPKA